MPENGCRSSDTPVCYLVPWLPSILMKTGLRQRPRNQPTPHAMSCFADFPNAGASPATRRAEPWYAIRRSTRRGMSARTSIRRPISITAAPTKVIVLRPGPEPVNAREREEAVTTLAVGEDEPDLLATGVEVVGEGDVVTPDVADVGVGLDVVVLAEVVVVWPCVVVVDAIVVVTPDVDVVEVELPPATAITGAMGLPVGVEVVMPEGVTESLG